MKRTGRRGEYLYYKGQAAPHIPLAPILLFASLFLLRSMIDVPVMSAQEYRLLKPDGRHFTGFQNFVTMLTEDKVFMKAIKNSVVWVAVSITAQAILGSWLAYLLNQKFKGRDPYWVLVLPPWIMAGAMVAITRPLIYGEVLGVPDDLLLELGLIDQNISWFSDSIRAMTAVTIVNVWRGIPSFTISYLSVLAGISDDIYESARIDGVRTMMILFKTTLPTIGDIIVIITLLHSVWTFNAVDLTDTLTGGGFNNATITMPLYTMQKFKSEYSYGYVSALVATASCIMVAVVLTYTKIGKLGKEEMY